MNTPQPSYRLYRPEVPLPVFVRQQAGPVIVHRRELAPLQQAGVPNVAALPHGGPQPGEAWVEQQA